MNLILACYFLIMFVSSCFGAGETVPVENFDKPGSLQAYQQALDDKFSVRGGTITGYVVFTPSITVNGDIAIGSRAQNIAETSGLLIFTPNIHNSSTTTGICSGNCTGPNTTFGSCLAGSTVTITTGANPVILSFTGIGSHSAIDASVGLTVLIDGAFPAGGYTSAIGLTIGISSFADGSSNLSFSFTTAALSAASHSFCVAAKAVSAGTWTVYNNSNVIPSFTASELR